ncbi:hypothetical protein RI367_008309 [Sorochytrium milnesiophthora]
MLAGLAKRTINISSAAATAANMLKVVPVPCLSDNYAYLLIDVPSKVAAAVDPVEPDKVIKAAQHHDVQLTHILTTHHHADHAGGNAKLASMIKPTVVGGDDRIPALNKTVKQGDKIKARRDTGISPGHCALTTVQEKIGSIEVTALETPCHTSGSISFYCTSGTEKAVFTGDTLFVGGCGRFFEGTPEQMVKALHHTLGSLPNDTLVYCGHEYTVSNLKFAHHVEPDSKDIADKLKWSEQQSCTVPSSIGEEKLINPFMRCSMAELQQSLQVSDTVSAMEKLRNLKNNFR